MFQFNDFVTAVERIAARTSTLAGRISQLRGARIVAPIVRSAVELAADELHRHIDDSTPFAMPKDMLQDEWEEPEIAVLRSAIDTLGLVASQRGPDLDDWLHDVDLAIESFRVAKTRFDQQVER